MAICDAERRWRQRTNQKRRLLLEGEAEVGGELPNILGAGSSNPSGGSTPVLSDEFNTGALMSGIVMSADGTTVYYCNDSNSVRYRTLSTPYDMSTAGAQGTYTPTYAGGGPSSGGRLRNITFNLDGTRVYITDFSNNRVYVFYLSTAYDVSEIHGALYDERFWTQTYQPIAHAFSNDGAYFYLWNGAGGVRRYTLATPWSFVGTSSATNDYTAEAVGTPAHGACYGALISSDGTRMIATQSSLRRIVQYTLSTPYDTRTSSSTADGYVNMTGGGVTTTGLHLNSSRSEFYMGHYGSTYMMQRYTY